MTRISFNKEDAEHLYELALEHFQLGCCQCDTLKKRLEKFIGEDAVKFSKGIVKKYPYCKN